MQADPHVRNWELKRRKQSYASAYDTVLKLQLKERLKMRRRRRQTKPEYVTADSKQSNGCKTIDDDMFIHVFGAPLFRLVSANWARLVVRRSFDLDLLEWRSSNCLDSKTIEEIKSRRVAITRHQRDIAASLDILRGLASTEKGIPLEQHELAPGFNLGRPNGFIATRSEKDSWWSIFWDFYELKASMDTLEKRASKIHDAIIGQIGVVGRENSKASNKHAWTLNVVAFVFTFILLPFSIVPPIFNTLDGHGGPKISVHSFAMAVGLAALCVMATFLALTLFLEVYEADELVRRPEMKCLSRIFGYIPKFLERDAVATLKEDREKEEMRAKSGKRRRFFGARICRNQQVAHQNGMADTV